MDPPIDGATFRRFSYPSEETTDDSHAHWLGTLEQLLEMQAGFSSYEGLLSGGEQVVEAIPPSPAPATVGQR